MIHGARAWGREQGSYLEMMLLIGHQSPGTSHISAAGHRLAGFRKTGVKIVVPVSRLQLLNNRLQMMVIKCLRDYKVVPRLQLAVAVIRKTGV